MKYSKLNLVIKRRLPVFYMYINYNENITEITFVINHTYELQTYFN
jgi:hypothetical protein